MQVARRFGVPIRVVRDAIEANSAGLIRWRSQGRSEKGRVVATDTGKPDPIWHARAVRLAEKVLSDVLDGIDALPNVSLLEAVLRAELGELPADEAADLDASFRRDEGDESDCICPPDLLARGGHRGGCPVRSFF